MVDLKEFNSFVKRYNLFQQSPTIYDAISGTTEFGPYGGTIKANLVNLMRGQFRSAGFWEVECPLIKKTQKEI